MVALGVDGKYAGTGLQLCAGRVPEIGAAVSLAPLDWNWSSVRGGRWGGFGVAGIYEPVVMLKACVAAAREVARVS